MGRIGKCSSQSRSAGVAAGRIVRASLREIRTGCLTAFFLVIAACGGGGGGRGTGASPVPSLADDVTPLAGTAGRFASTDGAGLAARPDDPTGVATDSAGKVYVGDFWNNIWY